MRVSRTVDPRTRPALLGAARQLFYARGLGATSVDDIAAASGLSKPTLYRHFPTKEALTAAYLNERNEELDAELRTWVEPVPPGRRPLAVIDWLCDWIARPGFNGCAFVRAYAELHQDERVREKARERKRVLLETILEACRAAGASDPVTLARQLTLIVEGTTTMAFVNGEPHAAADSARRLAGVALEAAGLEGA
jgi:AcrR family transcriptional regulator